MDDEALDALTRTDGEGRNVLEARLKLLVSVVKSAYADNRQLHNRCAELLAQIPAQELPL